LHDSGETFLKKNFRAVNGLFSIPKIRIISLPGMPIYLNLTVLSVSEYVGAVTRADKTIIVRIHGCEGD